MRYVLLFWEFLAIVFLSLECHRLNGEIESLKSAQEQLMERVNKLLEGRQ